MSGSPDQFSFSTLFVPTWTCLNNGSTVSVVLDNMIWSENSGVGTTVPGGQVVGSVDLFPLESLKPPRSPCWVHPSCLVVPL